LKIFIKNIEQTIKVTVTEVEDGGKKRRQERSESGSQRGKSA
jgi:hypothetical protein